MCPYYDAFADTTDYKSISFVVVLDSTLQHKARSILGVTWLSAPTCPVMECYHKLNGAQTPKDEFNYYCDMKGGMHIELRV